jgi:glycosyltransferase involved in cell wall biosynthesis
LFRGMIMQGVAVVIPCYNAAKFLRRAIESVLAQDYAGPVEVMIGDDGSTDDTIVIAESFGSSVKIIRRPESDKPNISANRNRCIRASSQPLISFLDADDYYLPGHLTNLANVIMARTDAGMAYCNGYHIFADDKVIGPRLSKSHRSIITADDLLPDCCLAVNGVMIRRSVLNCVGLFDENLSSVDDYDLWLRILEKFPAVYVPIFGFCYRMHSNQVSRTNPEFWDLAFIAFDRALKRYPYKRSNILKRKAVLTYHQGEYAFLEGHFAKGMWLLGKAAIFDPKRAYSELKQRVVKYLYRKH